MSRDRCQLCPESRHFVLADTLRHDHENWRVLSVSSPLLADIKALTRDRDRLLETQQAVESQLRMILEAYHPAPVRLFSSVDRQITLSFVLVLDYPTPAIAGRIKTTRMAGFLARSLLHRPCPGARPGRNVVSSIDDF